MARGRKPQADIPPPLDQVDEATDQRETKKVVVMAHPRSGTGYMSHLFRAFGMDVGHENDMGRDGIASWLFGGCENPRWGPDPNNYRFENRIHLVRNPVKVVASVLACVDEGVQEYMAREAGIDPEFAAPRRVLEVYCAWDKRIRIRKPNMRVRVEDAPAHLTKWLGREPSAAALPPTAVNCREEKLGGISDPPDFPLSYFKTNVRLDVFYGFLDLIREYGYQVSDV